MAEVADTQTSVLNQGISIHCHLFEGDGSQPEPIVFVHGWAGSAEDWLPLVENYHAQGYTCLVYDARGFGLSQFESREAAHKAEFSTASYVQDLLELLDYLELERVRLIGHSWGGVVAMSFTASYNQRVSSLVVIGGAYFDPKNPLHLFFKWVSWLMIWIIVAGKPLMKKSYKARQAAVRRYTFQPLPIESAETIMHDVIASDNYALEKTLLSGYEIDFKAVCPALTLPTLYVAGERDVVAPVQFVKPFVELTPHSRYAELPNCGHFPMQEMTQQLIAVIDTFWQQQPHKELM
jgi:pimeloyl-ACP methyl ester carboxylesterase